MFAMTFIGNIGGTPSLKELADGNVVTEISVAVNSRKAGAEPATLWIRVTAWNATARYLCQYAQKGDTLAVLVTRPPALRAYQNKNGTLGVSFECVAQSVALLGRRASTEDAEGNADSAPADMPSGDFPF